MLFQAESRFFFLFYLYILCTLYTFSYMSDSYSSDVHFCLKRGSKVLDLDSSSAFKMRFR